MGDVVTHKSSNQQMIVIDLDINYLCDCRFLNEVTGEYNNKVFYGFELELVELNQLKGKNDTR